MVHGMYCTFAEKDDGFGSIGVVLQNAERKCRNGRNAELHKSSAERIKV